MYSCRFQTLIAALLVLAPITNAFSVHPSDTADRSSSSALFAKKARRGRLAQEVGTSGGGIADKSGSNSRASTGGSAAATNWCPIPDGQALPKTPGQVGFLDTELPTLKVGATNPTGAVAAVAVADPEKPGSNQLYCFASSCPSCQVPLSKAEVLEGTEESNGAPQLACNFCRATYSLEDGTRMTENAKGGGNIFSGIVQSVMAAKENTTPLKMYKLGERKKKIVISVD